MDLSTCFSDSRHILIPDENRATFPVVYQTVASFCTHLQALAIWTQERIYILGHHVKDYKALSTEFSTSCYFAQFNS